MTDRERIVEAIAKGMESHGLLGGRLKAMARDALAALRAEGYEIYRPDECTYIEVEDIGNDDDLLDVMVTGAAPAGTYRLVPVGGDS